MMVRSQRLTKWLVQLGYCESRREAEHFLYDHRIEVDGELLEEGVDSKAVPEKVLIDREPMDSARLVIVLNKPAGYVCSHEDSGLRVYDLLPQRFRFRVPKLVTVGRLDKDTTGLLLLTDDGALVHKLTHPKYHVPKIYEVTLERPLNGSEATLFAKGTLMLEGEDAPLKPAEMEAVDSLHARLTLHEGRYHQVKRMFAATGNHVAALHRAAHGGLTLGSLPEGKWRQLTTADETLLLP